MKAIAGNIADFMHVLALCHGIVPSVDEDGELVRTKAYFHELMQYRYTVLRHLTKWRWPDTQAAAASSS